MAPFFKRSALSRVIIFAIITSFILSSVPQGFCSSNADADHLRTPQTLPADATAKKITKDLIDQSHKDGGSFPYVVNYDHKLAEKKEVAGGKCAQLAWAYNRGIPNPLGFSISVDAVRAYYNHNPQLIEMIKEVRELDTTDAKKRMNMARRIQDFMMKETRLPPDVLKEIADNYIAICKKISKERGYAEWQYIPMAYRGSGVIEDFEGAIPWFTKSIGAQPGQGTTLLNKVGLEPIEASVIEVIAGLFNYQIFGYRDVQAFFDFVSKMKDVAEYNTLIALAEKYGFAAEAGRLKDQDTPGYVNLRKVLKEIESKEPAVRSKYRWLEKLETAAAGIYEPMNFTTGIAVLEMVDADFSGTAFTSNMATGFDGSTYARKMKEKAKKDKGILSIFPSFKKRGENFKGYTRYVKINLGTGLGPGIVEGRFQPNIVTLFDRTGNGDWVYFEKTVGRKHMSLIGIEKVIDSLKEKFTKKQIYLLAKLYADWAKAEKDNDEDLKNDVIFELREQFGIMADPWARAMKDIWFFFERPNKYLATDAEKEALRAALNVNEKEFFTLASLVSAINKINTGYDTAAYMQTSPEMAASPLLSDEGYKKLAEVIVMVGDNMAQERFAAGDKGWRERRDVEFAVTKCLPNDASKFKVLLDHTYDLVTGEDLGPGWVKIVHLQNRPINPDKEIKDPNNIIFQRMKVDEEYIEANGIQPLASGGLMGFGAAEGTIYFVDPNKDLADQETEIRELKKTEPQVADVEEMGPEHDSIVEAAKAGIVRKGNDTSHAYIFSLELRLPIVINPVVKAGVQLKHGMKVVLDALHGAIYPGDRGIKLLKDDLIIRVNMLPKSIVGFIASTLQTAMEVARIGGKAVLVRQEFILNNVIKIYPQAARAYDLMLSLQKGDIKESDLTADDLKDVEILKTVPEDIEGIRKIITGFPSAQEFIAEQMRYAANQLGTIFPEDDEIRDYDNKEKEALLAGLVGAKAYLRYDDKDPRWDSPLDGMRGSQLMSHPHLKKAFFPLKRGVLRSMKDGYKNNQFFFVYLRTAEELNIQLADFAMLCREEGVFPEYIVVMIENGGNVWIMDDVARIMSDFAREHRADGVKGWKISFGTNDLNNSLGGTSRDDKDFTGEVKIKHPALINVEPAAGKIEVNPGYSYGPKNKGEPFAITINDETAPVVLRAVEHVSAVVDNNGGKKNLCGQGPTKAAGKGDWKGARTYLGMLDAVGTQSVAYVPMVMLDFDTQASHTRIEARALKNAAIATSLHGVREDARNIVVKGDVVVVNEPRDILKIRIGKNKQKIVVMKNTWSRDDLENQGIPWDYLNYAGAILLDEAMQGGDAGVLREATVQTRIKGVILPDASLKTGQDVTIDFSTGTVYQGLLATYQEKPVLRQMRMPAPGLVPELRPVMRFSASDLFVRQADKPAAIDIHPLAFVLSDEELAKQYGYAADEEFQKSFAPVRKQVKALIGNQKPMDYLQARISEYVAQKTQEAQKDGLVPVYSVFRLTRNQMRPLIGGELIEMYAGVKEKEGSNFDDPRKRLQGGTRALSDFWPILNLELAVFSDAKAGTPRLALQTSKMGTRVQEIIEMQLRVFKTFGISPENTDIGLEMTTSADPIMIQDYINQGIKFFTYKDKELAEALLAANLENPDIFAVEGKEKAAQEALVRPLAYVQGIVAENKNKGAWLGLTSDQIKAPVIPEGPDSGASRPATLPLVVDSSTVHGNIKTIGGGTVVPGGVTAASRMPKYSTIQLIEAAAKIKATSAAVYQKLVTGFGNFVTALRDVKVDDERVGVVVMGANAVLDNAGTFESLKQVKGAQHALKAVVWGEKPASDEEDVDLSSALAATGITKEAVVMLDSMENVLERIGEEYNIGQSKIMLMLSEKDVLALEKEYDMDIKEFLDRHPLLKATIVKNSASGEAAPMTLAFANLLARNLKVEAPALGSALARLTAMTYKDASSAVIAAVTDLTANLVTIMPVNVDAETAQAAQDYKDATAVARKLDIGV
ncbi:MAG TPA: PEP/pyruvate-binding domain-containing protein [Candidatus Omnitrophota bacterium]|nr:PEP/pyruvate-binding domain-containing protein [Candidatus Omnitrophota bacterium]